MLPIEPWYWASPKLNIPPSDATSQYPPPRPRRHPDDWLVEPDTTRRPGELGVPKLKIPPSDATSQ